MSHSLFPPLLRRLRGVFAGIAAFVIPFAASADLEVHPRLQTSIPSSFPTLGEGLNIMELGPQHELPLTIDLTLHSSDLWERVRNGFAMTDLNDDLVLYYQQWYMARPGMLRQMIERSRPYLHHIVEALEERGMPTELALLPMVESSFNPMAHSPAAASGLWQFIPATGRRFNLEQNWWQDERRDVFASTNAALDYLQTIYEMHGDWHLALASYNWGEGAVKRAVERNAANGLPTDYPNLRMPKETRHYVPKLQALKNIIGNPETFARLNLPLIPNEPYLATAAAPRPMDVSTAARLANMSVEEFRHLNPSHNRPIIKAHTPLILPADRIALFNANLARHQAPLTQWQAYAVKSPQRVNDIASQLGVSSRELIQVNGLPGNVRLAAGSKLLVPGSGSQESLQRMLGMESSPAIIAPEPKVRGKKGKKDKGASSAKDRKPSAGKSSASAAKPTKARSGKASQAPTPRGGKKKR